MLPFTSVTVQVTVVEPGLNTAGASLVVEAIPQLSAVTGEPSTTVDEVHTPASGDTVTSAGQVIVGSSLSVTVTT